MDARIQVERIVPSLLLTVVSPLLPELPEWVAYLHLPPAQLCCPTISRTARPLEDPPTTMLQLRLPRGERS
jgi:hypothetical protein